MTQALTNVLLMDAVVGCLQTPKTVTAASKLAYFDKITHEGLESPGVLHLLTSSLRSFWLIMAFYFYRVQTYVLWNYIVPFLIYLYYIILNRSRDGASHHFRDSQTQDQPFSGHGWASDSARAAVHSRCCSIDRLSFSLFELCLLDVLLFTFTFTWTCFNSHSAMKKRLVHISNGMLWITGWALTLRVPLRYGNYHVLCIFSDLYL